MVLIEWKLWSRMTAEGVFWHGMELWFTEKLIRANNSSCRTDPRCWRHIARIITADIVTVDRDSMLTLLNVSLSHSDFIRSQEVFGESAYSILFTHSHLMKCLSSMVSLIVVKALLLPFSLRCHWQRTFNKYINYYSMHTINVCSDIVVETC